MCLLPVISRQDNTEQKKVQCRNKLIGHNISENKIVLGLFTYHVCKIFWKLAILTIWYTHVWMRIRGFKLPVSQNILGTYWVNDPFWWEQYSHRNENDYIIFSLYNFKYQDFLSQLFLKLNITFFNFLFFY